MKKIGSVCLLLLLMMSLLLYGCSSQGAQPTNTNGSASGNTSPADTAPGSETAAPASEESKFPQSIADALEGAKQEGEVSIFFSVSSTPQQVAAFEKALEDYYGFPMKVTMDYSLHPQKAREVVEAYKSNVNPGIDVFTSAEMIFAPLDKAELMLDLTELGQDFGVENMVADGKAIPFGDGSKSNVVYNTDLVKGDDIPKSYDDLLDPKWKGKIVVPRSATPYAIIGGSHGEEYATKFVEGLKQQGAVIVPSYPDMLSRVVSGEFAIGIGVESVAFQRQGAPLGDAPIAPFVSSPWATSMLKDVPHPNAAKLVMYYMITPEGQKVLDELFGLGLASEEGTKINRVVNGREVEYLPYDYYLNDYTTFSQKYSEMLGIK